MLFFNLWNVLMILFLFVLHVTMLGLMKLNPESWLGYRSKRCVTHFDNFASYSSLMLSITRPCPVNSSRPHVILSGRSLINPAHGDLWRRRESNPRPVALQLSYQ